MSADLYKNLEKVVATKIANSIADFVAQDELTFFGYFLQNVNFYRTTKISTGGVNFKNLRMNFYYNQKFIDKLTIKQTKFFCIHELFHLLFNHPKRGQGYHHGIANLCMDMIINEIIMEKYCEDVYYDKKRTKEAVAEFIPGCVIMDSHYKDERIFELIFVWLNDKYTLWKSKHYDSHKECKIKKIMENFSEFSDEDVSEELNQTITEERKKENEELGIDELTRKFFEADCVSLDEHFWDDIPDNIREQIVNKYIDNVRGMRGITSHDSEEILGRLRKKNNNDFLKLLKKSISTLKGFSKSNSFRKQSKKGLDGLKGIVKHSDCINCILDTSGSMMGNFEIVLSEIFRDDYRINMIQCDSEVKSYVSVSNKNQLQSMKLKGLGGTVLQSGIDYILSNRSLKQNNLVILTDGSTDTLDFSKCPGMKVLILSADKKCPLEKEFNNVTQVIVQNKNIK